ncbi:alpha/beta fold hydrolase [Vallicoccus soli]|uniref:Alpha/beta hydrolase n=1 Tax=Vallicoccus soli TaxID=2339232 RepID=A0A3A3Z5P3_9ACTN|nr:alpha/beta hydrolase [Vallicoccus soli]RJK98288.1 alpha/beta hydrolase [Vallicoccus soli]
MTEPTTRTLEVPGAVLAYDVREGTGDEPPLLLVGSPMGAAGFATLAGHFPHRTVVTYDPRGVERSRVTSGRVRTEVAEHAEDLHAVVGAVGGGPVDVFGSSGGAVNALELVVRHPRDVRTLVAHEPASAPVLPDREQALAACRRVAEVYQERGHGAGMAAFIAVVAHEGPFPDGFLADPPDPAAFGMPADDDGTRDDPLLGRNMLASTGHEHDLAALRVAPTRVVVAAGEASGAQMARRGAEGMARRLGVELTVFPGDHGGFLGGEYGQTGEPEAFGKRLREVLEG